MPPVAAMLRPGGPCAEPHLCPQPAPLGAPAAQGEDCLFLNVWTPPPAAGARLPVLVFIHGGAYVAGEGGGAATDGAYMAREGQVVVVTINYRLGVLGFLAHPALVAEDAHGSAGN